ncbi:GT-D fold domain-containing glycosyltransferase [Bacillus sp. SCS-151]|uniref:GT-D fold domain-containing protein n=1 Tax=Nanhaiella sioensis TaxID=3115293 RepID=UPI00397D7EF4
MYNISKSEWQKLKKYGHVEVGNNKNYAVEGLYYGGDKIVEESLNKQFILPFSIENIIDAGIKQLSEEKIKLKNAEHIANEIREALRNGKGYSLVRIGDGELIFLSHDLINSSEEINKEPRLQFLSYAGVTLPDHETRDFLTEKLLLTNVIGVPIARYPTFQNLFIKLVNYHNWNLKKMNVTSSFIHFELCRYTTLYHELLQHHRVLLIGNKMNEGRKYFEDIGYENIVGNVPVFGVKDVSNVITRAKEYEYDVVFVSAGIAANLICVELAQEGKIAIDFGHLIDSLINDKAHILSLDSNLLDVSKCSDIGYYYVNWGDYKTAAYWYEQILKMENLSSEWMKIAHLQLCVCHWELHDLQKANEHNEYAETYAPNDPSVLHNKAFFKDILKNNEG